MSQRLSLCAVVALALVSLGAVTSNARTSQDPSADEAAIRQIVVQQIQDAWNAKDGRAFAAPFAPDADYVNVLGRYSTGRDVIEKEHTALFSTIHKESHNLRAVQSIRFLRPDVAVVHVEGRLWTRPGGEPRGHNINLMVMTKDDGKWSIAAFQNTPIREPGAGVPDAPAPATTPEVLRKSEGTRAGSPLLTNAEENAEEMCPRILADGSLLDCEEERDVTMEFLMVAQSDSEHCRNHQSSCSQSFIVRCDDYWSEEHSTDHAILH